jgi:hypothetical protein
MRGRGSRSTAPPERGRRLILELVSVGRSLKVTAVDEATGAEASFVAPANTARADIERLARSKLAYVMKKQSGGN